MALEKKEIVFYFFNHKQKNHDKVFEELSEWNSNTSVNTNYWFKYTVI